MIHEYWQYVGYDVYLYLMIRASLPFHTGKIRVLLCYMMIERMRQYEEKTDITAHQRDHRTMHDLLLRTGGAIACDGG